MCPSCWVFSVLFLSKIPHMVWYPHILIKCHYSNLFSLAVNLKQVKSRIHEWIQAHLHSSCSCWKGYAWSADGRRSHCLVQDHCTLYTLGWDWCRHTSLQSPLRVQFPNKHHCRSQSLIHLEIHGIIQGYVQSHGPLCQCDQMFHKRRDSAQFHLCKKRKIGKSLIMFA